MSILYAPGVQGAKLAGLYKDTVLPIRPVFSEREEDDVCPGEVDGMPTKQLTDICKRKALVRPTPREQSPDVSELRRRLAGDNFILLLVQLLIKDPILKHLKTHQENLDCFDIEQIFTWSQAVDAEHVGNPDSFYKSHWDNVIRRYSQGRLYPNDNSQSHEHDQCYQKIMEYLVSSSLKDCSVIVTIREIGKGVVLSSSEVFQAGDKQFEYKIKLIDVDIKPFSKIPGFHEKDAAIAS
ncbi:hypothetical protein HDU67_000217 [Dinochytrium kinnereticum]|nr:hypothetical protein HDU67_000217 [Dinochytrium kinnereticum]